MVYIVCGVSVERLRDFFIAREMRAREMRVSGGRNAIVFLAFWFSCLGGFLGLRLYDSLVP